jgi:glutathione S-transferase
MDPRSGVIELFCMNAQNSGGNPKVAAARYCSPSRRWISAISASHSRAAAAISAWERRAYDEGMVGHAEIFRNSHPNFVDRGLPGHREPVPQIPALIDRGKLRVARFHKKFNEQLARNKFVAGDKFSVADITTITVADFGHALKMQIPDDCPHVKRWYDEMQQRDSVLKSRPTHLPDGSPMPIAA